jgi:hypothetical protein
MESGCSNRGIRAWVSSLACFAEEVRAAETVDEIRGQVNFGKTKTEGVQVMNLRAYFQKIRATESSIDSDAVLTVSLATDDGGLEGLKSEVSRELAAKLIVDGKVRLASPEEASAHRAEQEEKRRLLAERDASGRLQVAILSDRQVESFIKDRKKG